jgi:hypothetical protein
MTKQGFIAVTIISVLLNLVNTFLTNKSKNLNKFTAGVFILGDIINKFVPEALENTPPESCSSRSVSRNTNDNTRRKKCQTRWAVCGRARSISPNTDSSTKTAGVIFRISFPVWKTYASRIHY